MRLTYKALRPSGLGNYFVYKRFAVQILLWSLEFVIQINLEHDTIAARLMYNLQFSKESSQYRDAANKVNRYGCHLCAYQATLLWDLS